MVLTAKSLKRVDISNPVRPRETAQIPVQGRRVDEMRVRENWVYLNGPGTQSIYDGGRTGLRKMGPHDVRAWVAGRYMDGGVAQRVVRPANRFEVWETVE